MWIRWSRGLTEQVVLTSARPRGQLGPAARRLSSDSSRTRSACIVESRPARSFIFLLLWLFVTVASYDPIETICCYNLLR